MDMGNLLEKEGDGYEQVPKDDTAARGTESSAPATSHSEFFASSWQLLGVLFLLGIHGEVDQQLLTPFYYSRVVSPRLSRLPGLLTCTRPQ
jgi:hypothetical protein